MSSPASRCRSVNCSTRRSLSWTTRFNSTFRTPLIVSSCVLFSVRSSSSCQSTTKCFEDEWNRREDRLQPSIFGWELFKSGVRSNLWMKAKKREDCDHIPTVNIETNWMFDDRWDSAARKIEWATKAKVSMRSQDRTRRRKDERTILCDVRGETKKIESSSMFERTFDVFIVNCCWTFQCRFHALLKSRALRRWLFRLRNPTPTPKFFFFWLRLRLRLREKIFSPSDSTSDSEENFSRSPVWTPKNSEIFLSKEKDVWCDFLWNEGRVAQ